ncbi:MAG: hypothetical protein WKG06_04560 [Segetibacter sp.]
MRNSITPGQLIPEVFIQKNTVTKNNNTPNSATESEAKISELENELKKQKVDAEKGAKLMQIIWGDKFQSDSLH